MRLIDAEETIAAIVNSASKIGFHDNSEVARYGAAFRQHEIIDIIEALPTAERPRGRWVRRMYDEPVTCSECGGAALALSLIDEFGDEVLSRYCPHCGAFMENNDVDNE